MKKKMESLKNAFRSQIDLSHPEYDAIILRKGSFVYKRSFTSLSRHKLVSSKYEWHWFAITPDYGSDDTYGPIVSTWRLNEDLAVLDISTMKVRRLLAHILDIPVTNIDCDEQYSGGRGNMKVHAALLPIVENEDLDGTIILDDVSDEDCEGPSELVLRTVSLEKLSKM